MTCMNFLKMNRDDFMNLNKSENISFLSFSIFKNKSLIAAVSARSGGVSSGRFSSLNMKFLEGEKSENVVENRKRFLKVFDISYKKSNLLRGCKYSLTIYNRTPILSIARRNEFT